MRKYPQALFKLIPEGIAAKRRLRRDEERIKRALYKNKDFYLIRVSNETGDADKVTLRLVCPASDPSIARDIEEQGGYYCISHLWGPPEKWEEWCDSGVIDRQGNPMSVKIRPEKRAKLLRLFNTYKGYWWLDVFCARHDTPLDIMGDIYRLSKATYALIDCPEGSLSHLGNAIDVWDFIAAQMYIQINDVVHTYLNRLQDLTSDVAADDVTWDEVVGAVFKWGYTLGQNVDHYIEAVIAIYSCSWFSRVWTLQEALLPKRLYFMYEYDDYAFSYVNSDFFTSIMEFGSEIIRRAQDVSSKQMKDIPNSPFIQARLAKHSKKLSGRGLVLVYGSVHSDAFLDRVLLGDALFPLLLLYLSLDKRTCLDPCDYVYGVLGYLEIRLPRMCDPAEVWQAFLSQVKLQLPKGAPLPVSFDLANAKDMASVYASFQPRELLKLTETWKYVSDFFLIPG
ncbi:hypothetical protein BX666DRAFT_2025438 [Dichotomocladium elegans]|nr:hypothetical protein BX666DRAFT_2025438 [Dichotomocladium elegans]